MKILILGSNGMLGMALQSQLGQNYEVVGIDKVFNNKTKVKFYQMDLLEFERVKSILLQEKPNIIINVAAIVNLKLCEENKELANLLHIDLNKQISLISEVLKCRYIYISTDSIFDGKMGNYKEENRTNPLNYYAVTKLKGEEEIQKNLKDCLIIRTNIYGYSENQNSLLKWAYNSLKNNEKIVGYNNVIFNPVSVYQLAEIIEELIKKQYKGIINIGSNKIISKFDFIRIVAKYLKKEEFLISGELDDNTSKIIRPKNTSLSLTKMRKILNKEYNLEEEILRIIREVENEDRK